MWTFGNRKVQGVPGVEALLARQAELESAVRLLETEQINLHDQVRKWMRRSVAAERVVLRARPTAGPGTGPVSALPMPRPTTLRGALGRRYVRQLEEAAQAALSGNSPSSDEDFDTAPNGAAREE